MRYRPLLFRKLGREMQPRQVRTIADARALVAERELTHVKVGVFDVDGILRGKYMSRAKLDSALDGGFGFCDVVLGWDSTDHDIAKTEAAIERGVEFGA